MNAESKSYFEDLFMHMPGPLYVVRADPVTGQRAFHRVNDAFATLMECSVSDIIGMSTVDLIHEEDHNVVESRLDARSLPGQRVTFDFRIKTKNGKIVPIEVSVIPLQSPWQEFEIGIVKDISDRNELEIEVARQRENTLRAFQSTARIWHITDMIRAAFTAMEELANAATVDGLLDGAIKLLTSSTGLDFRSATIYLLEGDRLSVASSAGDTSARSVSLDKNGRLARIFKGTETEKDMRGDDITILLRGRDKNVGLIRVIEHKNRDTELLTEPIQRMRDSVLRTLANTLSLLIRNINLYKKVQEQSVIDPLTKVYNRRHFDAKIIEELDRASRYDHPLSVIILDIDHFKRINDDHGHLQGDKILESIGEILSSRVRKSDVLCRYGGEEFVILLPMTSLEVGRRVAEEIRAIVEENPFDTLAESGEPFHITVSIGVSCYHAERDGVAIEPSILVGAADTALYEAKDGGRNKVVVREELV